MCFPWCIPITNSAFPHLFLVPTTTRCTRTIPTLCTVGQAIILQPIMEAVDDTGDIVKPHRQDSEEV